MVKIVDFVNQKCESAAYTELYEQVIEPQTDMDFTEENFLKVQESILQFLLVWNDSAINYTTNFFVNFEFIANFCENKTVAFLWLLL